MLVASAAWLALAPTGVAGAASAFKPRPWTPQTEAQNFSKVEERQTIYDTPGYQALLRTVSARNEIAANLEQVNDPGREFHDHLCSTGDDGCAGDARLYAWQTSGYGIVQPVYFTARDGATISGHVWATRDRSRLASGHRDHGRLGAGRRAAVLVRRPGPGQGRLRGPHLGRAGPGSERHLRGGARPAGGRAGPERRSPLLRRDRGRRRLLPLDAVTALRARAELHDRARVTQPSRTGVSPRASTTPTTRSRPSSIPPGSGSPDTPTGRPASPTSASGTRG